MPENTLCHDVILEGLPKCFSLLLFDTLPSTNLYCREAAEESVRPLAVIANAQSHGRGRLGRTFHSPKGAGLYLSLLLPKPYCQGDFGYLTAAAAVAVTQAIRRVAGVTPQIKWVNDIYMKGKKIAGILAEGVFSPSGELSYAILGIGINCRHTDLPPELSDIAASIEDAAGTAPDRSELAKEIFDALFSQPFDSPYVISEYKARSLLIGKRITVYSTKEQREALVLGIDGQCGLMIRFDNGEQTVLRTGEVSVRELDKTAPAMPSNASQIQ